MLLAPIPALAVGVLVVQRHGVGTGTWGQQLAGLAASLGAVWLAASLLTLVLLPMPFLAGAVSGGERGSESLALAAYLAVVCGAPFVGSFPVPLLGFGLSPILGYTLAIGWLIRARRAGDARADPLPRPRVVVPTS